MKAVLSCLREAVRSDLNRAVIAVAPGNEPTAVRVRHPQPFRGGFDLEGEEIPVADASPDGGAAATNHE